jgi:hypothetical protein
LRYLKPPLDAPIAMKIISKGQEMKINIWFPNRVWWWACLS